MTCVHRPGATVQPPVAPPTVPDRTSSLTNDVTPADDLLYLVGRKPFIHNIQDPMHNSSSPESLGVNQFVDTLLDTSTDDSASVYSVASSIGGRSGSLHRGLARTASDALSRMSADSDGSRRLVRTRSPGLAVAQPAISSESPESTQSGKEGGRETRRHQVLRGTKSLPPQPEECEEQESGLVEIKEGEELRSPRNSLDREVSPDLMSLPTSPTRKMAPGSSRKMKMASRRGPGSVAARKARSCECTVYLCGRRICFGFKR